MNSTHKLSLLAALALSALAQTAGAQSTYSIPNPIMKPASYGAPSGNPGGAPVGTPVPRDNSPQAQVPPLPPAISAASLPGQSSYGSAPGNDTVIRDTLATFTVTAVVGDRAVLRNNVGFVGQSESKRSGNGGGNSDAANGGPNGNSPAALPRQAVIRVKSGTSVYVAGVELTPTVLESRVEFRVVGKKSIVSTVTLESQSSYGYVPATAGREAADPAVSNRVSPQLTASGTRPAGDQPAVGSAPNGSAQTPR